MVGAERRVDARLEIRADAGRHVRRAVVDERLDEPLRRPPDVAEVHEVDAPGRPEPADRGREVVRHQGDVPLAQGHAVRRARLELEHPVICVQRAHDPRDTAEWREGRVVRMERQPDTGLLGDRHDTLEEPAEGLPETLLGDGSARRVRRVPPDGKIEAGRRRSAAGGCGARRPRPGDDRHPVVTEHLDPEPSHRPDELEHRLELVLAPREPEPEPVHRRVVLDHGQPQTGVLHLLPEEREGPVAPRRLGRVRPPVAEAAREHADRLLDPDLPELVPGRRAPRLEQDLGEAQHVRSS